MLLGGGYFHDPGVWKLQMEDKFGSHRCIQA